MSKRGQPESQESSEATIDVVYLDYNASAPLRPEALEAMLPHLRTAGNASSVHAFGRIAERAVDHARRQLADLIDCGPNELVMTSGATEANNLALGLAAHRGAIATSAVEHPAVLQAASSLAEDGAVSHIVIGVDRHGAIDLAALRQELSAHVVGLVSVMAANNETGVLADLDAIVAIAHEAGALVHTDATQAVGRVPISLRDLDVDMLSLSAHKFGGPQGVGALFVRRSARIEQRPMLVGGGHERGWRAGTTNVAGVVGMGAAAAVCGETLDFEASRVRELRERLESELTTAIPDSWVNGAGSARLPGTSSITFRGAPADAVMMAMSDVAVSDGSACHSGAPSPSHVLLAMALNREDADSTLRFSLGYATTRRDVDRAIETTVAAVRGVRDLLVPSQGERSSYQPSGDIDRSAELLHEGHRS
jgi:cysteine desulfurase